MVDIIVNDAREVQGDGNLTGTWHIRQTVYKRKDPQEPSEYVVKAEDLMSQWADMAIPDTPVDESESDLTREANWLFD